MSNLPLPHASCGCWGFCWGMVDGPTSVRRKAEEGPNWTCFEVFVLRHLPFKNKQSNRHANRVTGKRRLTGNSTKAGVNTHAHIFSQSSELYSTHSTIISNRGSCLHRGCLPYPFRAHIANLKSVCVAASPPCRGLVRNEERRLTAAHQLQQEIVPEIML